MFTGIIEDLGEVVSLQSDKENLHITVKSRLTPELKIDQSVSHDGVCLTVIAKKNGLYTVTAIKETLDRTTLRGLQNGKFLNLERAMKLGDRLDGHLVQGHIDQTAVCTAIKELQGSWIYNFNYDNSPGNITIVKGSITINGVSLTVVNSRKDGFSVAIIPYTYENTNFKWLQVNAIVNLEFDVIGKYVSSLYLLRS